MKIAVFSDTFKPRVDGVTISTYQFIEALTEKGHEFLIFCPEYSSDNTVEIAGNKIIRLSSLPLPSYPEIRMALPAPGIIRNALETFKPDLIHFQTPGFIGQFAVLAAKHYGIPLVGTYHTLVSKQGTYLSPYRLLKLDTLNDFFESKNPILNFMESISRTAEQLIAKPMISSLCNNIYENADLIISPSRTVKKELIDAGIHTPIRVVSNGIDRKQFPGKPKELNSEEVKILYAGRISFEKNCNIVLDAFEIILKTLPSAQLNFIGTGPALESLKISAEEKNIAHSVTFSGMIPHEKLYEEFIQHDVFITASTMETQGMVVLEAISSGLPCIGVNSHALPELIVNGENGFLSKEGDYRSLAENALRILQDRELYRQFSVQSIEISLRHSLEASCIKLEEIYKDMQQIKAK